MSVGLSYCKFLANLASDLDKPRGFAVLSRMEAKAWLAPLSVGRLWGVGRVGRERLEQLGFRVIGDLTTFDQDIDDKAELTRFLLSHCDRVAARPRREGLSARGVTLKLCLPDFSLRTRSRGGLKPTQLAPRLFAAARPLLDAQPEGRAYRLLGWPRPNSRLLKTPTRST